MTTDRISPPIIGRRGFTQELNIALASLTDDARAERAAIVAKIEAERAQATAETEAALSTSCPCCGSGTVHPSVAERYRRFLAWDAVERAKLMDPPLT